MAAGDRDQVAVIGAGAAGLSAARHLLDQGVDVVVLELGSAIGGLWVYENDNGRSPAYDSLHINSEAAITHYRDFPFPDGTPLYPSHRQVHAYLEAYAAHFGITPRIRFRTEVIGIEQEDAGEGWTVRLADGTAERFSAVVVASGHHAAPRHPPFAADFAGEYLHANEYRTPEPFRGRRVAVIGTGNSGLDIAADVCLVTEQTFVAARSPVLIMPRTLFGAPTARLLGRFGIPRLPWPLQRRIRELLTRIVHGRMQQWGLTPPRKRTHPTSHPTFMAHVAYERIAIRPGVAAVRGTEIEFVDGRREQVDAMIAATGYEVGLPFLTDETTPFLDGRITAYRRVVHPDRPGLYFVGLFNVSGGANIRMMDVQAEWVAALVTGRAGLPTRAAMQEDLARERRLLASRYPDAPRYELELDPGPYVDQVAEDLRRPVDPAAATAGRGSRRSSSVAS